MTLELIRSLWRDKPAKHGRHYIFRDGKVVGPHDVWCTDRSHSPSRSVWVYVDGETHKTCTTNGCKVLLAEEVKQFIPLPIAPPPPEGQTEAGADGEAASLKSFRPPPVHRERQDVHGAAGE